MSKLFKYDRGIIPALDTRNLGLGANIARETRSIEHINGYKVGWMLALRYGLGMVTARLKPFHDGLSVIYDHQKGGTDIPDLGGEFAQLMFESGIDAAILFPFGGCETLKVWVKALQDFGIIPIVGGHMTQKGFFVSEGGYISDEAPERVYGMSAQLGVMDFVMPGNKVNFVERYRGQLDRELGVGAFSVSAPGFIDQGGEISDAGKVAGPKFNGIFGRQFTNSEDPRGTALELVSKLV